ncbi:MAG: NAD-dependent epimerase/dehydratase family protein [Saprospiraceae bacterium]|nr:NAD-dependent epimerase/dehydratase family protein [Saprospiraceae bacterium]
MKRRAFSRQLLLGSATVFTPHSIFSPPRDPLNILVLGGTNYVGPSIVNYAIKRGHHVYLFNRGQTNPTLFTDLPHLQGDRNLGSKGYAVLKNKYWHAIIDTWPEKANLVEDSTSLLKSSTDHYLYLSSGEVYLNNLNHLDENSDIVSTAIPESTWTYREHKVACENLIRDVFPRNHTIIRSGLIKGWRDFNNDLAYWLVRIRRGEVLLGPGDGTDALQFIDVKDLSHFIIHILEQKIMGTYNVAGPTMNTFTWFDLLSLARKKINSEAKIIWNSSQFLAHNEVQPLSDMPMWSPESGGKGYCIMNQMKAWQSGLHLRPVTKTFRDVLSWFDYKYPPDFQFGEGGFISPGLSTQREQSLIDTIS